MKKAHCSQLIILLIILLFSYTAMSKLLEHDKFVFQMRLSPMPLMSLSAPWLSWFVPLLEAAIVIGLLFPSWQVRALYITFLLMCLFEVYIGSMLLSGNHLPCTCGGIISKMSWRTHLLFNAVVIFLTFLAIRWRKHKPAVHNTDAGYQDLSRA